MKTLVAWLVVAQAVGWALPTNSAAEPHQTVIVVVGAAGAPEYAPEFARWAGLWQQACSRGGAEFVAIGLDNNAASSDRDRIHEALAEQSRQTTAPLWLVLIGHGTSDGRTARFNLRGSDLAASDLAEWLKPVNRPIAIINTASASAPFLKELSAPGRVVITATKSGFEYNYARFGQYLAEAIAQPQADLDKDGQTSLLEAWLTASHTVGAFYTAAGRLATEHALLDDNGDGLGTPAEWFRGIRPVQKARDDTTLDGYRAHQFHLVASPTEIAMPPELRARRDQLELTIMELRDTKAQFSEAEYFSKLEPLLREIANIYEKAEPSGRLEESRSGLLWEGKISLFDFSLPNPGRASGDSACPFFNEIEPRDSVEEYRPDLLSSKRRNPDQSIVSSVTDSWSLMMMRLPATTGCA